MTIRHTHKRLKSGEIKVVQTKKKNTFGGEARGQVDRRQEEVKAIHYIASTDVKTRPHVTAQWEGDLLVEIVVNNLFGEQLSHAEYLAAWQVANDLKSTREQC